MAYIQTECAARNAGADQCANRACQVEGWFVVEVFSMFLAGQVVDPAMQHANGFDRVQDCPIDTGVKGAKACCGQYPERFSYKTLNGKRHCCVNHSYNADLLTCCDDGKAKLAC